MEQREFIVEQETAGQRIDRFLSGEDTGLSRSALQALVAEGHVQCNGKAVAKSLKLKAGDTVLLEIPDAKPIEAVPQDIPLEIVYEDGDLLVVNDTRVLPARLLGHKKGTGGAAESLLLDKVDGAPDTPQEQTWNCMVKPGKRLKPGNVIEYCTGGADEGEPILEGEIVSIDADNGSRAVRFTTLTGEDVDTVFHKVVHTPLPPYITQYEGDEELYQTVYSRPDLERSAAAPTAGLHFTEELLDRIKAKGVNVATVDLEVGLDTFRLVEEENAEDHKMHTELYTVSPETVQMIRDTKAAGGRVIAVGTTSVRSLESAARSGELAPCSRAATNLYIMPGYEYKVVDAIITNFHVPRSTLMMLVSAFSTRDIIMHAYEQAKERDYRFFSFGDAMFIS